MRYLPYPTLLALGSLLLFGGTVHENLTLWDPTVPEEALLDARERLEAIPWSTELVEEKVGGIGRR